MRTPTDSTQLHDNLRIPESWERRWLLSFNVGKCPQLTVTEKRNRIPTSYTLYNQILEGVTSVKYLGVELKENLHWENHTQSTAAKSDKVSAFAYRNLKECLTAVQTHCYKGLVRPMLEYASVVWDPHQQHLKSTLEIVQ